MTKKDFDKQKPSYPTNGQPYSHSSPPSSDPFQAQSGSPFKPSGSPFQPTGGPFEQGSPFQTGSNARFEGEEYDFAAAPESATALFSAELFGDLDIAPAAEPPARHTATPSLELELEQKLPDRARTATKATQTQSLSIPPPIVKQPSSSGKIILILGLLVVLGGGGTAAAYFLGFFDAPPAPVVRRAIEISSIPTGATLWIDNKKMPQPTPLALNLVVGRKYSLRVEALGHKPQRALLTLSDRGEKVTQKVQYTLQKLDAPPTSPQTRQDPLPQTRQDPIPPITPPSTEKLGTIEILCKTEGANLSIQADPSASPSPTIPTPNLVCKLAPQKLQLPPGKYILTTTKDGFDNDEQKIEIIAEQAQTLSIELQETQTKPSRKRRRKSTQRGTPPAHRNGVRLRGAAEITISSNFPGTIVRWRGKKLGKTPLTHRFPAGPQTVTVEHPSLFSRLDKTFTVTPKTNQTVAVEFKKGRIKFIIQPWADVTINGQKIGQTPMPPYTAWPGVYTIQLQMKDKSAQKIINLKSGGTSTIRHSFNE
ncbi:PEGA domain-containing protein [Myxococcota bacterium]|nr:PEGA domain-containing protein [Myxococcota bacterium]